MRSLGCLLLAVCMLSSCVSANRNGLPEIVATETGALADGCCTRMFPQKPWQYVHALNFRLADGGSGSGLGVVSLDRDSIRCALMSVEGLTLFEAHSPFDGRVEVSRALPPFDGREFAAGLMRDLRALFFIPPGSLDLGRLENGRIVCRFAAQQRITDILPGDDGCWQVHLYADRVNTGSIETHTCHGVDSVFVAQTMELMVPGPAGYTISLRLLSAEPL